MDPLTESLRAAREAAAPVSQQSAAHPPRTAVGVGTAGGHHGEILQGVFYDQAGRLHRALVTLPFAAMSAAATFRPGAVQTLEVVPRWKSKALRAARVTLEALGQPLSGTLTIEGKAPTCWGLGSSTSDVTAAIRAVAAAWGVALSPCQVAALAVEAEQAADSVMFEEAPVLFAHREGFVLEEFARHLPAMTVLGFNSDSSGRGIDTLNLPLASYDEKDAETLHHLRELLRRAFNEQDTGLVGLVCSSSSRINQKYLEKPSFDSLENLACKVLALGIQVAHSGTVMGLLFDSASPTLEEQIAEATAKLREQSISTPYRFSPSWRLYD